jgi:hypothetical protein
MQDFTELARQARRATAGRNVLSVLSLLFLAGSLAFWGVLHWSVLVPSRSAWPQMIVALVLTTVYTFALPLLLSMLIPTTPAGQLLQKTQWRTIGFWVIIVAVGWLFKYALDLMTTWFRAQPNIADTGLLRPYVIACVIAFIVVPALAWVQVTPERWIQEIEAAHAVKKLEILQAGELAILKAQLVRVEQQTVIGWANLLPAEQKEVGETIRGLLMAISDNQRLIARTVGAQAAAERALGDPEIANGLDYVQRMLAMPARHLDRQLALANDDDQIEDVAPPRSTAAERGRSGDLDRDPRADLSRAQPGSAGLRSADRQKYEVAIQKLGSDVWDHEELAKTLGIKFDTARKLRNEWMKADLVESAGSEGRFYFTEYEEVRK